MALCEFTDKSGVTWQVWEVHPKLNERRIVALRRRSARNTVERRLIDMPRYSLSKGFDHGWLAFRSSVERRRRTAIPDHWEDLSNDGFCALLRDTQLSGPVRRLID